jgi:hypothetical protein
VARQRRGDPGGVAGEGRSRSRGGIVGEEQMVVVWHNGGGGGGGGRGHDAG